MADAKWALVPFVPLAQREDQPRTADMRGVLNAMLYIAGSGKRLVKDWESPSTFAPSMSDRQCSESTANSFYWSTAHVWMVQEKTK